MASFAIRRVADYPTRTQGRLASFHVQGPSFELRLGLQRQALRRGQPATQRPSCFDDPSSPYRPYTSPSRVPPDGEAVRDKLEAKKWQNLARLQRGGDRNVGSTSEYKGDFSKASNCAVWKCRRYADCANSRKRTGG